MPRDRLVLSVLCATLAACKQTEVVPSFPDTFVGVGIELTMQDDVPVVTRTIQGGSADRAGIHAGDRILKVDGLPTEGASLGDVVMRIRGQPETQVTLTLDRRGKRLIVIVRRRKMAKTGDDYAREPERSTQAPPDRQLEKKSKSRGRARGRDRKRRR